MIYSQDLTDNSIKQTKYVTNKYNVRKKINMTPVPKSKFLNQMVQSNDN